MEEKKTNRLQILIVVLAACLIFALMQGVHDNYGIMMNGLLETTGLEYSQISFCIGAGALVYGFAQPFLGMLALKKSNGFVLMLGVVCMITGLVMTPLCHHFIPLLIFFGLVLPFGTTGLAFGILMGAITPVLGEKRAAVVSGIVQASAGIGDALMAPALQSSISSIGIGWSLRLLALPFLLLIPVVIWLSAKSHQASGKQEEKRDESLFQILRSAFQNRNYRLILIGFSTCGFNMSIIESHLFSQYLSYGISGSLSSLALTVYGITTMAGAAGIGFLSMKFRQKNLLGSIYLIRVFLSLGFLILPKGVGFAFAATALLGLTGDSTVPPTSGIISETFGPRKMAVLYGFALACHQVGAFLSAWLGGVFVDAGLGYSPLWAVNMVLAAIAAAASYSIRKEV